MDGNPIREGPDGYLIHELDGQEYDSIWTWADAVLRKFGITYDYVYQDTFKGQERTIVDTGAPRRFNCVEIRHWGEVQCWHAYDSWDYYHQGLIDFACILHARGIEIRQPGPTSSSNRTMVVEMVGAD